MSKKRTEAVESAKEKIRNMKEIAEDFNLKDSEVRPIETKTADAIASALVRTSAGDDVILNKEKKEMKELKTEVSVKKKTDWKKIALITAAGLAVVGTGIAIAVKIKNGQSVDAEEVLPLITVPASSTCTDLYFSDAGIDYAATTLWDKTGSEMTTMMVESMSLNDLSKMFQQMNPDIFGVSEQTVWDKLLLVREV